MELFIGCRMQRFSDSPVTHGQHGKVLGGEERPGQHLRAVLHLQM